MNLMDILQIIADELNVKYKQDISTKKQYQAITTIDMNGCVIPICIKNFTKKTYPCDKISIIIDDGIILLRKFSLFWEQGRTNTNSPSNNSIINLSSSKTSKNVILLNIIFYQLFFKFLFS